MKTILVILWMAATLTLPGQDRILADPKAESRAKLSHLYRASVAALLTSHALDISSSYSRPESNPLLRSPSGQFTGRSVGIKLGITTGILVIQRVIVRRAERRGEREGERARKAAAIVNFAASGAAGGVAARNWRVEARR